MKSLAIVMVAACPFPSNHGGAASIREMSEALSSRGHKVHVVTYPINQQIPVDGVTVHTAGNMFRNKKVSVGPTYYKPLLDLLLVHKVRKIIEQESIDIIHAHNYEGAIVGYIAKKFTRRPMLYNAVNNMIDELPSYNFIKPEILSIGLANMLDKYIPRMGDYITVVSEELYDFLSKKGIPRDLMSIIPAGVNTEMFGCKDRDLMRNKYNIGARPLVVYTGTLSPFQRVDLLLKAMRVVVDRIKDAVLLVVGNIINPKDLDDHMRLTVDLGLKNNVIFTEECPLDEIPYFLASADVTVVPRPFCPGFPVKLLNYMAAGKAIVTFEGSEKGLINMHNAIIVKGYDCEGFGKAIITLINDPELSERLGVNAKKAIKGNFDWSTLAIRIEEIYYKILNRGNKK